MSSQTFRFWLSSLISIFLASPALAADVSYERKAKARDLTNQAVDLKGTANAQRGAELLWQAAALDPDNAVIQYDLGLAFSELKRYQEGWKCFQKAVVLDPLMADAWVQLSQAYGDCGDFKRAIAMVDDIKRRF